MKPTFAVVGGGIAGLSAAIALQQKGYEVSIFEASPIIRAVGAGLVLAANAMKGLHKLGIAKEIIEAGRVLSSFKILDFNGKIINETDSDNLTKKYGISNFTIHRAVLHRLLLSKIPEHCIYTNKKAVDIRQSVAGVSIIFEDGTTHQTQYLIVADGVHSPLRQRLLPDSAPRYAGYTCWRAVIDNADLKLEETSETWGAKGRFGIVPLANNQIYWFACVNAPQNSAIMKQYKSKELQAQFSHFHDPIPTILRATKDEAIIWNDIIDLRPIQQFAFGNILLIGDAAHATTPNMGQGACQAIEDVAVLAQLLENDTDIVAIFKRFENRRLARTHSIVNGSWRLGRLAQWENPILIALRNRAFRMIPKSVSEKQLKIVYEVDF